METQIMVHTLLSNEQPTKLYYMELHTGERLEADSPLALFDAIAGQGYFDSEDRVTQTIMRMNLCKNVATQLGANGVKSDCWANSRYYSNYEASTNDGLAEELLFTEDETIDLDAWDEQTTMLSLIRAGYLKLYEKVSTFSKRGQKSSCEGCQFLNDKNECAAFQASQVLGRVQNCVFWTEKESYGEEYREVNLKEIPAEPYWKYKYVPLAVRNREIAQAKQ